MTRDILISLPLRVVLLLFSVMLVGCSRAPKALTVSNTAVSSSLRSALTDTVRVRDSVRVEVRNDTVWRERVLTRYRQVELNHTDTVVRVICEQQTVPVRYVPRWLRWEASIASILVVVLFAVLMLRRWYRR